MYLIVLYLLNFCIISLYTFQARIIIYFGGFDINILELNILILLPGRYFFCFNLESSTIKCIFF